jgi:hypothetical protein
MRQLKSNWHHFDLQAQHSYGGKESFKMTRNKWVMYFHHGNFLFLHLKKNYPLGYKEKALIEWQGLKLRKGQIVQEYTDEFRKMALMLDISLHT